MHRVSAFLVFYPYKQKICFGATYILGGDESGRGGGGGGVMNCVIGICMYTLECIKWMTNKNLLYKKINF